MVHLAWLFELSDIDMNGITDRITATEPGQTDTLTCDGLVIVMTTGLVRAGVIICIMSCDTGYQASSSGNCVLVSGQLVSVS